MADIPDEVVLEAIKREVRISRCLMNSIMIIVSFVIY